MSPAVLSFLAINAAKEHGFSITFKRGPSTVSGVLANRGRSTLEVDDASGGVRIQTISHDFIVRASDLGMTPQKRDWVIAGSATYELLTPPYSPHDHAGELLRLHTKLLFVTPDQSSG